MQYFPVYALEYFVMFEVMRLSQVHAKEGRKLTFVKTVNFETAYIFKP